MNLKRHAAFAAAACAFALALGLLSGCSARIEGQVSSGGAAVISLDAALAPRMSALLASLAALRGGEAGDAGAPALDAAVIAASIQKAPGVASAAFKNTSPTRVEGRLELSRVGDFLAAAEGKAGERFITFEEAGGGGALRLALDRESAPEVLGLLSEDVRDYLSALLAPAATGEALSRAEYLDLARSIYGEAIAAEIAAARLRASLRFPAPVREVLGGKASGRAAEFDVPLLDILVLDEPCVYKVTW